MDPLSSYDDTRLIAHILERYHDVHRADLPDLVAVADVLAARGVVPELAGHLATMHAEIEAHLFKEEMRLFPMIEQGGGSLVGHLVDDMASEHESHRAAIARLGELVAQLPSAEPDPAVATLRSGIGKLVADLHEHMRIEDDILFARFDAPRPPIHG
jgi:regulator of cell morphogenesis and NO signaling